MNYKKKYENALEWARRVINGECGFIRKDVEEVFPELKESRDERIRKEIIDYIKIGTYKKDWIAWLEKQGEQILDNSAKTCKDAWSEEDEKIYQSIMDDTVQENQLNSKQTDWLRNIKYRHFSRPTQEWSEKDENMLEKAIKLLDEFGGDRNAGAYTLQEMSCRNCADWFKSLKQRLQ